MPSGVRLAMDETEKLPAVKRPSWWKIAFNIVLVLGLIGAFVRELYKNWDGIIAYPWHLLNWELAMAAMGELLFCSLLEILIWNRALGCFVEPLSFVKVVPVFIWSNLARYIPGKVASLFLRTALGVEAGRPAVPVLATSALELALRTASALLIFIICLPAWGQTGRTDRNTELFLITAIVIIAVVMVCAHPKISMPVLNWGLKKIKQPSIAHRLRYRDILGLIVLEMIRWVLVGISVFLLAWAIYPPARYAMLALIGMANASWAAGFLSLAPGGVGVAEGVQILVLSKSLGFPHEVALILPVSARVWSLAAESLWALAAWPLYARWSRKGTAVPVEETVNSS